MPGTLKLKSEAGGSVILAANTTAASDLTVTVPASSGTMVVSPQLLTVPNTAGTMVVSPQLLTVPNTAGTVMVSGNQPLFWAYANTTQNITTNTLTQVSFGAKLYDTATCFNNTNGTVTLNGLSVPAYAFCPNVAGYYQITFAVNSNSTITRAAADIRKNGSDALYGNDVAGASQVNTMQSTGILYLNGTGDYIQAYTYFTGTSPQIYGGAAAYTFFLACLIRTA
jgi:hypothetical protein